MKKIAVNLLDRIGFRVIKKSSFDYLVTESASNKLKKVQLEKMLLLFAGSESSKIRLCLNSSKAQIGQDIVAFVLSGCKRDGYFVEFGAGNGKDGSNTYSLEKRFNWNGILSEPATVWHRELCMHRKCKIDHRCVWRVSGHEIEFRESAGGYLSGIAEIESSATQKNQSSKTYFVETVSLRDLLIAHKAPKFIDYLSIDTEGSEYEILKDFDFGEYRFGFISVEHNQTAIKGQIGQLLSSAGYRRLKMPYDFEDWYVDSAISAALEERLRLQVE